MKIRIGKRPAQRIGGAARRAGPVPKSRAVAVTGFPTAIVKGGGAPAVARCKTCVRVLKG